MEAENCVTRTFHG